MPQPADFIAFDERGFVLRPSLLDSDLVQHLSGVLERLEQTPDSELEPGCTISRTPVLRELRFLNVLACDDAFLQPLAQPALLELADAWVSKPYRLVEVSALSRKRGLGVPLHSIAQADSRSTPTGPRTCLLKVAIALSDIGPDEGPMVVFEGSHKLNGEFPYGLIHPEWKPSGIDSDVESQFLEQSKDRDNRPWEEIPGYREIQLRAGDAIVFTDDLWHGARAHNSDAVRRLLCFTYAPYHFANMHGIQHPREVVARAAPELRALLSGPFQGTRYSAVDTRSIPDELGFPQLADSKVPVEFGTVLQAPTSCSSSTSNSSESANGDDEVSACLQRLINPVTDERALGNGFAPSSAANAVDSDLAGCCVFRLSGEGGGAWSVELKNGTATLTEGECDQATSRLELSAADLVRASRGEADPVRLFYDGRAQARGDVSFIMRLIDRWTPRNGSPG